MFRLVIAALTLGLVLACATPPQKQINKEKIKKNASEAMEKIE